MAVVVEVRDRIDSLADDWERLAESTKATPFLWPGWFGAWWRAFGTGRLHILSAHEDGRLVGVLPLIEFRRALSSLTNAESGCFGLLAADEPAARALAHAVFDSRPRHVSLSCMLPAGGGASPT